LCVVGFTYDLEGTGARFAPEAARRASRRIQPWHRGFKQSLQSRDLRVVDASDVQLNSYDIRAASKMAELGLQSVLEYGRACVALGGDHGITYGLLRAVHERFGQVALVHFDAQLDAHGTPLKWAAAQKLVDTRHSIHVGIRGTTSSSRDDEIDGELGFESLHMREAAAIGPKGVVERIVKRLTRRDGTIMDAFVLLDMDVLDPAFAPGVATPEIGGLNPSDMQMILEGLQGSTSVVSAAILGASPEADPTKVTALTMATLANDLLHLLAKGGTGLQPPPLPMPKKTKASEL
jgi:agmatinase